MACAASSSIAIDESLSDILGEGWQDIVECPICLTLMVKPKFLSCGHCVCEDCERKIVDNVARDGHGITCPKCWMTTDVPAGGLAVNYALQDAIGLAQEEKKKAMEGQDKMQYVCVPCDKKTEAGDMWLCQDCNSIFVCGTCACREHRAHAILNVAEIIDDRNNQVEAWKEQMRERIEELAVGRDAVVISAREAKYKLAHFTEYLEGPFARWFDMMRNSLATDITSLTCVEDGVVDGGDRVGIEGLQPKLDDKESAIADLIQKQRTVSHASRGLCDMIDKFKENMTLYHAPPPFDEGDKKRKRKHKD